MTADSDVYQPGAGVSSDSGRLAFLKDPPDDVVQECIDALNRPMAPTNTEQEWNWLPDGVLPGHAEGSNYPYDKCGEHLPLTCSTCGSPADGSNWCDRLGCPEPKCWRIAVKNRAVEVGSRVNALRASLDARRQDHVKAHHVVISLPKERCFVSEEPLERFFEAVKELLASLGIPAVAAYHANRIKDDGVTFDLDDDLLDNRGAWKYVLNMDDPKSELVFAPHIHLICVSEWIPGNEFTEKFYEATGCVWKRITKRSSDASIYDDEDLAAVTSYMLSHTPLLETERGYSSQYRYFGAEWQDVNVIPSYRDQFEAVMRGVVPRTLGLRLEQTTCRTAVDDPSQLLVTYKPGAASSSTSTSGSSDESHDSNTDATGEVAVGSSGIVAATSSVPDDVDAFVKPAECGPCNGRLLTPWEAAPLVQDDLWLASAEFGDVALETVREWYVANGKDWPPPD